MSFRSQAYIKSTQYIEGSAVETTSENLLIIHKPDGTSFEVTDYSEIDKIAKTIEDEFNFNQYQRDRLAEYPSIQELVVALYDADDKAEIDKKRAEIKKKYPKPE